MRKLVLLFLILLLFSCQRNTPVRIVYSSPVPIKVRGKIALFPAEGLQQMGKGLLRALQTLSSGHRFSFVLHQDTSWSSSGFSRQQHIMAALMQAMERGYDFILIIWPLQKDVQELTFEVSLQEVTRRLEKRRAVIKVSPPSVEEKLASYILKKVL